MDAARGAHRMGLARQLWLLLVVPIAVALAVYGVLAHERRRSVFTQEASYELADHAEVLEVTLGSAVVEGNVEQLRARVARLAEPQSILGIAVFSPDGAVILASDRLAGAAAELAPRALSALGAGRPAEWEQDLLGTRALVRTVGLDGARDAGVVAVVARDLGRVEALSRILDRGLLLTGLVVVALTAIVVGAVSRSTIGRPAQAIVDGVERVAGGDLEAQVPERGAEELARLARAFNAMTRSLTEARARVEAEEAARAEVERRLQHAQALAAAGQVAASIGHEIGSPLNVILGRARLAAAHPHCPEEVRGALETIATQSARISRVVAQLLAVARPPRVAGRGSDLARVAEEALAFLGPECRKRRIGTRLERREGPAAVSLDADRAFQVVFNLCLNALHAQEQGGELTVRVTPASRRGDIGGGRVALEVEDRGPGISPDDAAHVFEPFFTTKHEHGGSGLGLAIVRGIVQEAGGVVELCAGANGGALFRVVLPAASAVETGTVREVSA